MPQTDHVAQDSMTFSTPVGEMHVRPGDEYGVVDGVDSEAGSALRYILRTLNPSQKVLITITYGDGIAPPQIEPP